VNCRNCGGPTSDATRHKCDWCGSLTDRAARLIDADPLARSVYERNLYGSALERQWESMWEAQQDATRQYHQAMSLLGMLRGMYQ
jgi:hypothetical protein